MKSQKSWSPDETAVIYHFVLLGYNNKEIQEICYSQPGAGPLYQRSIDSIGAKTSEVRKWVSDQKGYKVSNYDISERVHKALTKASKIAASEFVFNNTPSPLRQFIPMVVKGGAPVIIAPQQVCTPPQKPQFFRCEPNTMPVDLDIIEDKYSPAVNDMAEFFSMAKDLGAIEVEYKGLRIKF